MYPLTERVKGLLEKNKGPEAQILTFIQSELSEDCHIEHILSHLGDMIALAERAKDSAFQIGEKRIKKIELQALHHQILRHIRDVLRFGYKPKTADSKEQIGDKNKPIVSVDDHRRFLIPRACSLRHDKL